MNRRIIAPIASIGFDHLLKILDKVENQAAGQAYPPYNVERRSETGYAISLAVAGFAPDEIEITTEENVLTISGRKAGEDKGEYIYRGIAARSFERKFTLAQYLEVRSAKFEHGVLTVEIERVVPEPLQKRSIKINADVADPEAVAAE
jgi:molecular chaperone IbpA